eukprot:scaffold104064_cov26-Tisochrysis_lutea.AAC.3
MAVASSEPLRLSACKADLPAKKRSKASRDLLATDRHPRNQWRPPRPAVVTLRRGSDRILPSPILGRNE